MSHLRLQRDIACRAAARAERMTVNKGEFLATMSHEIRTPLNSMIGLTELLLESDLNAHQKQQLHTVMSSAESLLYIVNDILDFSKIESGKLTLDDQPYSPRQLVEEVVTGQLPRVREQSRAHKLEILYAVAPDVPQLVRGDAMRVRQIISNLVSNAVKFTARGYILVQVERPVPETIRYIVTDTGIGIADDKRELIFDKFAQADGQLTTQQFGGTGLGLAICRQLVQLMQGTVRVSSREHVGTSFMVELPCHNEQSVGTPRPLSATIGRRALIVDNTEPTALWLRNLLTQMGVRSFISEDIQSANVTLRQAADTGMSIEYIFIEHQLPDGTDSEFAQALAAETLLHAPKLIGMSQNDAASLAAQFARAGGHAYLRKPIHPQSLIELLQRADEPHAPFVDSALFHAASAEKAGIYPDYHRFGVLLVEDNRVNREMALQILGKFGIAVSCAENGREALEQAQIQRFDLILMDCQMPVMDGFEASRILRARMDDQQMAETPIIALTANAMKGDRERCLAAGMSDYLCKPLRMAEMKSMLACWLRHKTDLAA